MKNALALPRLAAQAMLALACAVAVAAPPDAAPPPPKAAAPNKGEPTTVDADSLHYDDLKQISVFTGHVILTKGALALHADRLELREDPEGYQYGVATASAGKLVSVDQRRAGADESVAGVAERVEYDGRSQQLRFISKAVVRRLACGQMIDEVRGQQVVYDQRSATYSAVGGPQAPTSNQRVRAIIQPKTPDGLGCAAPAKAQP